MSLSCLSICFLHLGFFEVALSKLLERLFVKPQWCRWPPLCRNSVQASPRLVPSPAELVLQRMRISNCLANHRTSFAANDLQGMRRGCSALQHQPVHLSKLLKALESPRAWIAEHPNFPTVRYTKSSPTPTLDWSVSAP